MSVADRKRYQAYKGLSYCNQLFAMQTAPDIKLEQNARKLLPWNIALEK